MAKKEPIMYHGLLKDHLNVKALIEAQANEPSFINKPNTNQKKLILTKKQVRNRKD